jgi:hypothetical protein
VVLRPIFQWLKYWPGDRAVVGIFVIPTIVALLFAALPVSRSRAPSGGHGDGHGAWAHVRP